MWEREMIEGPIIDSESSQLSAVTNDVTFQLADIWRKLLGVEFVSPDDNYFDLGGDSILAVQLFSQIEREFGTKLPVATLFEAPTIAEMAAIISSQTLSSPAAHNRWSSLVPVQTLGSRPPFFCVHGAGGNVLLYRHLSHNLGIDQPFYGLQSRGLDGSCPPLTTVEEMAAHYVKEIRRVSPRGPYFLGGYCGGGTIAYEVAQQFRRAGEQVALLALFDCMDWSHFPPLPSFWAKVYYRWQKSLFHIANVAILNWKGKLEFVSEKAHVLRSRVPVWRGMLLSKISRHKTTADSQSRVLGEIWRNNDRAFCRYIPNPYPGVVTDFRPLKQYRMFSNPEAKWQKLAQAGQEVISLPVYPAGMLVEPFVKYLALALREAMDRAVNSAMR